MISIIDKLFTDCDATDNELVKLIESFAYDSYLFQKADEVRKRAYGTDVYIRGLIELTNFCGNDCLYCGIRRGNTNAARYRLTKEQVLACCREGYNLGFRTFVLQGGEDGYFSDDRVCDIVASIKNLYNDCAVTLSIGEKSYASYKKYFDAGADRYLLRHETAGDEHYNKLHPAEMSLSARKECLFNLKRIGYQVGSGFMVGSPWQNTGNLVLDIRFLQELKPSMIGIGPFISHRDSVFSQHKNGNISLCLRMIAILRLMFPRTLIPATTALGTIAENGREQGLSVGANVVMPNLSPVGVRELYKLYDNKLISKEEAAESVERLKERISAIGYQVVVHRGDSKC